MDESADESSTQEPFTFSLEEHDTDTSHESSSQHDSIDSDAEKSIESIDENSCSREVDQSARELTSNIIRVKRESDEMCSDLVNDNTTEEEMESSDQILKEELEEEEDEEAEEEEQSELELTDQKFPEEEEEDEQSEFELEDRQSESELIDQRLKEEQEKFTESELMNQEQLQEREKPCEEKLIGQEAGENRKKHFESGITHQERKEREDDEVNEQQLTNQIPRVEEMSLGAEDIKKELFINLVDLNPLKSDNEDICDENVSSRGSKNEGNHNDRTSDTRIENNSLQNEVENSNDLVDQCKKLIESNAVVTDTNTETTISIVRSKFLDNVNTDLPNTELSNVDISSLDMESTETYERNRSDQPQTNLLDDLLDDLSDDFVGFDSEIINDTVQKIRILREKQEEIIQLQRVKAKKEKPDIEVGDVPDSLAVEVRSDTTPIAQQPPVSSSRSSINYVYQLTRDKNIFEEQVPSGSKRVKKKRTLYGDFIEPESGSITKKLSITKEAEGSLKKDISCENKENLVTGEKVKEPVVAESEPALMAALTTTPISKIPIKTKRSSLFDISKPLYKEPFKYGWKREISYRDLSEGSKNTKTAYVAYFDPDGKKVKSLRQIAEKLPPGSALSINNFTFSKERIFSDDDCNNFELIRRLKNINKDLSETEIVAKHPVAEIPNSNTPVSEEHLKVNSKKKSSSSRPKSLTTVNNTDSENRIIVAPSSKPKSSKKKRVEVNDGDADDAPSAPTSKMAMPRILIRNANSSSSKSVKVPSRNSNQKKVVKKSTKKSVENTEKQELKEKTDLQLAVTVLEHGDKSLIRENSLATLEYNGYSPAMHYQKEESRGMPACSISCPLAMGFPPTLQCTLCLNFYHSKCCGYDTNDQPMHNFLCKNCQQVDRNVESQNSSEYLLAVSESSNSVCLMGSGNKAELSARLAKSVPKIVDGVTTWLPSSSNIQLSSSKTEWNRLNSTASSSCSESQSSLLQSVLELDGKRYIIVPKESIVSISPNANATINTFDEFRKERLARERESMSPGRQASPTNLLSAASIPNTFLNNLLNINSSDPVSSSPVSRSFHTAGVDDATIDSSLYCPSDNRNHIGNNRIKANVHGIDRSSKRKSSEEYDSSAFPAKKAKTDVSRIHSSTCHSPLTLSNIALMHNPLTLCFKYLTVKELLRVSMTCKYLNCVASDSALWKIVRLKNSKITNWEGFAKALQKHGTRRLDMRKMLCPTSAEDLDTMWEHFFRVIPSVKSLERIDFMRCSSDVVHTVAQTCPHLKVINALQLNRSSEVSLGKFTNSSCLKELRLKGFPGVNLEANVYKLKFNSSSLQTLSLTNMKNLNMEALNAIRTLENLRILELGECESLSKDFTDILISFKKLEKLRLEKVVNLDPEYKLFAILKHLKHLKSLELINIEVKVGFDKALKACQNLEEFLLIPLYRKESATANKLIVDGIQTLSKSLKKFVWGLTTELLEITNIFLQEYHGSKLRDNEGPSNNSVNANNGAKIMPKKGHADADSIPITKKSSDKADKVEVDIVPIWQLEMQLGTSLPHTKVKVLRIPFNSTGRQSLSDSFK